MILISAVQGGGEEISCGACVGLHRDADFTVVRPISLVIVVPTGSGRVLRYAQCSQHVAWNQAFGCDRCEILGRTHTGHVDWQVLLFATDDIGNGSGSNTVDSRSTAL